MSEEAFECLAETEKLVVKQRMELAEMAVNAVANAVDMDILGNLGETANKYDVYTDDGGKKFFVAETSEYCMRVCCKPNHALQLHVYRPDMGNQEIMVMDRPCKCGGCCALADICQQEMLLYSGSSTEGTPVATIKQPILGGMFSPRLQVMDRDSNQVIANIQAEAQCCIGGLCCDHTFKADDGSGNPIGKITKEAPESMGELAKEMAGDADIFTFQVNKDLDTDRKAALLGALHLIDYMFFEDEGAVNIDVVNGACSFKCCDMYCMGCKIPCKCSCGGDGGDDHD